MSSLGSEVTLANLGERLDGLTDLFRRRLLEDRSKQAVIEDLQTRLTDAEKAVAAGALRPVVDGLALAIERVAGAGASADLCGSIVDELEEVIASLGVQRILANAGDPIDRVRHEVVSASGDGSELRVGELVRVGYEKNGVVLRVAKVTAVWSRPAEAATSNPTD